MLESCKPFWKFFFLKWIPFLSYFSLFLSVGFVTSPTVKMMVQEKYRQHDQQLGSTHKDPNWSSEVIPWHWREGKTEAGSLNVPARCSVCFHRLCSPSCCVPGVRVLASSLFTGKQANTLQSIGGRAGCPRNERASSSASNRDTRS